VRVNAVVDTRRSRCGSWLGSALAVLGACVPPGARAVDADSNEPTWVGTWAAAPQPFMPGHLESFRNQSLRLIVHTSVGGTRVRIKISNLFGDRPLRLGAARVARRTVEADIDSGSDRELTFGGQRSTLVPAGSIVASDPVSLDVPALADLAVSLFLPDTTAATTSHFLALQTSYVSSDSGDTTGATRFTVAKTTDSWPFLTGVEVDASRTGFAIVAFGDSGIDGDGCTSDKNTRWPDVLAVRLQASNVRNVGVLNEGMIGNRLLRDSPQGAGGEFGAAFGPAGLARFERDALEQPGARYIVVRLGVNDIGFPDALSPGAERVTAENLIAGYRQLIERARARSIRVVGATITPFENATLAPGYYTKEKEAVRQRVNDWIRGGGEFDVVVDLDRLVADPSHPARLLPSYDSGDHLHANDAGYAAIGSAMPLTLFERHSGR
jgi:lysophospholipase L1-like esterase